VGIVSTFLSAFPVLLDRLVPLTTALGNLFAPLAGVLLFHYLFVARMRIDVPALFDPKGIYHYWHGVNVTAVVWCFVGGGVYYLLPIGALPAVIVPLITGAGYFLTMRVQERMQRVPLKAGKTMNSKPPLRTNEGIKPSLAGLFVSLSLPSTACWAKFSRPCGTLSVAHR